MDAVCPGCGQIVSAEVVGEDDDGNVIQYRTHIAFDHLPDGRYIAVEGKTWIPDDNKWGTGAILHECRSGGGGTAGDRAPRAPNPPTRAGFLEDGPPTH